MKLNKSKLLTATLNNKSVIILLLLMVAAQIASGGLFFTTSNIMSVLKANSYTCVMALGFLVVLASGNLDLSVGHMLGLLAIVYAMLSQSMPAGFALVLTLLCGVLCGLFNAILAIKLKLLPFILTLATGQIFRGAAYLLSGGRSITITSKLGSFIGSGKLFDVIPVNFLIVVVLTVIMMVVMYRTAFGAHILATGGNEQAAKVSGINTGRSKIIAFVVCGFMNAVAAIIVSGRITVGMPNVGDGLEMDAIAAVVIGGTALSGGKAKVFGAIIGCLIMGIITNMLNLAHVSSYWQWVAKGIIIVFAILIDEKSNLLLRRRTKKA